jgi:hypothetical protein
MLKRITTNGPRDAAPKNLSKLITEFLLKVVVENVTSAIGCDVLNSWTQAAMKRVPEMFLPRARRVLTADAIRISGKN